MQRGKQKPQGFDGKGMQRSQGFDVNWTAGQVEEQLKGLSLP